MAAAGARTLQAALQEQLTHEKVLARRLSDRLEHSGDPGRGLHSFPIQLNLSSSVHRITCLSS